MSTPAFKKEAQQTYANLLRDLRDRSGLGDVWDEIDVDVRNQEIRPAWCAIIAAALAAAYQQGREDEKREVARQWVDSLGDSNG